MENLKFSRTEMAAILYWARLMAVADGKAHPNEVKMMVNEANRFGISVSDNKSLSYREKLNKRKSIFKEATKTRKAIHTVFVTTSGLVQNAYANEIQNSVCVNDLFS